MIDILSAICVGFGVTLMFISAFGVYRLSDFYLRVHAPTKAATLGLFFLIAAYVLKMSEKGNQNYHSKMDLSWTDSKRGLILTL